MKNGSVTSGEHGGEGDERDDLGDKDVEDLGVPDKDLKVCKRLVESVFCVFTTSFSWIVVMHPEGRKPVVLSKSKRSILF